MSIIAESLYLLNSSKEKCNFLIIKDNRSPNDIADLLINLHLVLEVALNGLFRELIINSITKDAIDKAKIVDNLDQITFIDKATLFIYMPKFNFGNDLADANKHHSVIGKLKDFSRTRNKLAHGSMIGSFLDGGSNVTSSVELLTEDHLKKQINKFKSIIEGITFFLDHLSDTPSNKDTLKTKFLDVSFLSNE